jgi:hypothetical protein
MTSNYKAEEIENLYAVNKILLSRKEIVVRFLCKPCTPLFLG